jgi:hypothetical protein
MTNNALASYPMIVEEWDALKAQLAWWLDENQAVRYASAASAAWFLEACEGFPTRIGPYAELYSIAFDLARPELSDFAGLSTQEALHSVKLPTYTRACNMARLYGVLGMVAEHGGWSTADKAELAQGIEAWRPERLSIFGLAAKIAEPVHRMTLLRCAVEATDAHRCVGDAACERTAVVWEREDLRSYDWMQDERAYRKANP